LDIGAAAQAGQSSDPHRIVQYWFIGRRFGKPRAPKGSQVAFECDSGREAFAHKNAYRELSSGRGYKCLHDWEMSCGESNVEFGIISDELHATRSPREARFDHNREIDLLNQPRNRLTIGSISERREFDLPG